MSELKPEAILTYLGFEADKIKTEDDFKTNFESKFGVKELLLKDPAFTGKIFGQKIGSIEAKVKANAKKMGVDFAPDEIKDKGVEDILELSFVKIAENFKKATEEAEKAQKGTVDEQVKTWKEKYAQIESKFKDTEGLLNKTVTEFGDFKKDSVNKFKSQNIARYKNEVIGKLEFKQDITPVEKLGFQSVLDEKYEFDLDENEAPFIKDKKTGQRIPSKKVVGTFMNAQEILEEELIANKLTKLNKDGGKPAPKYNTTIVPPTQGEQKKMFIHPNALKAAGM